MPFTSEAQRRFMWATHPDIAQRWANEDKKAGRSEKGLPYHHRKSKLSKHMKRKKA
jgi:hypothetical protein